MNLDRALENAAARRILLTLLERQRSAPSRTRAPMLRLTAERVPEFGPHRNAGEAEGAWDALCAIAEAGLMKLEPAKPRPGYASYELDPLVRLQLAEYERACALLGIPAVLVSRAQVWREALEDAFPGEPVLHEALAQHWVEVPGHTPSEVAARLRALRDQTEGAFLRAISAKLFWGDSKVLDERQELVALVCGREGCPFPESPVQMQVHAIDAAFVAVLFVENAMSFEYLRRAAEQGDLARYALAQVHGFRGAAQRIRKPSGCSLYASDASPLAAVARFREWLYGDQVNVSVFFWGDLDFSGMAILKALRSAFPETFAWEPGYGALLQLLDEGHGHEAVQAGKERQRDPGETGCPYADERLLPAIRAANRFVDQEATVTTARS